MPELSGVALRSTLVFVSDYPAQAVVSPDTTASSLLANLAEHVTFQ